MTCSECPICQIWKKVRTGVIVVSIAYLIFSLIWGVTFVIWTSTSAVISHELFEAIKAAYLPHIWDIVALILGGILAAAIVAFAGDPE